MTLILRRIVAGLALALMATMAMAQSEYRVRPGDTLVIEVLEDPNLNRSVQVLPDGRFSFPFAGSLQAAGRSTGEIQSTITSAISSNFAVEPNVFVTVQPSERSTLGGAGGPATTRTMDVYFLGEVNAPGLVEVSPGTSFLQAMAQAGGLTRFAATKRVQLRRTDSTGRQKVYQINYRALSDGAELSDEIELRSGDVILVPERRLFE